jgi:hypothetical protein
MVTEGLLYCRVLRNSRPEGPIVNSPGREAGVRISGNVSAEGAALAFFLPMAIEMWVRFRACLRFEGGSKLPHSKKASHFVTVFMKWST